MTNVVPLRPRPPSSTTAGQIASRIIETDIPARMERLLWSRFHTLVVGALGITWILDGLEVTLASSISGALKSETGLSLSDTEVGLAGSAYLLGAVVGALIFGWLADRIGRKRLIFITIAIYLVATALTGLSWNEASFFFFRFLTGAGIGGEYSAVNSTIQELMPARYRGFTDLVINGSYWIGAALGAGVAVVLLNQSIFPAAIGWRAAFFVGAVIGIGVFFLRFLIPESPRWLIIHGREKEAAEAIDDIENRVRAGGGQTPPVAREARLKLQTRDHTTLAEVFDTLFRKHRKRTVVALTLMAGQAFFYNAIFFTYALVLARFYQVASGDIGWYILPFAASNFLGPLLLGKLFDTIGRRVMIAATYAISAILLFGTGILFVNDALTATTQTLAWMAVFFFASPAASAAYLTVSETFPIEVRALTISFFFAVGTGLGGVAAPFVFGKLIESGSRVSVFEGYAFAAAFMLVAAIVAALFAVDAERKSLEEVATPLSAK